MKRLLLIAIFFISIASNAQEFRVRYENTLLKEVLLELEDKTNFSFSYSEAIIASKTVTFSGEITDPLIFFQRLSEQTGLRFEKVSETQIIISKPNTQITICGYVFEGDLKTPLPFATVLISGSTKGTTTDENGFFSLEDVAQDSEFSIQYVGFSDAILRSSEYENDSCKNILMKLEAVSLQEVVVMSYLTKGVDKNANGSFTLRSKALGGLPGLVEPDVFQSIQLVPGIASLDDSASDIQIRGGSPDQNLILFDGIKMYNVGHFFGMISAINPYIVENTDIYKGGASPEYGDRISGVIDIRSADAVPKKTEGGFGVNGTHADVFLKTKWNKHIGLIASGRRSYTDYLQTPSFEALSEKVFQNTKLVTGPEGEFIEDDEEESELTSDDNFFFYDITGKLIIEPSRKDRIMVSGIATFNELDFFSRDDEDVSQDLLVVKNEGASFDWSGTKWGKLRHSLKVNYSALTSNYRNTIRDGLLEEEENLRNNTVEDYGVDLNLTYDFLPRHALKLGYQYSRAEVFFQLFRDEDGDADIEPEDEEEIPIPSESRDFNVRRRNVNQANSVYGEYTYSPKNRGVVHMGLRGSHYSAVDRFYVEPRLNMEYPLSSSVRIKGTLEQRFQPLSQLIAFEDTQLRLENNIWTLSNTTDIPVLESFQFSGGLLFSAGGWTLDLDGYSKNIKGLTSFTNGFTNAAEELAEGESTIFGVDFLVRKQIKNYRVWLGYTFNDIQYNFPELQPTSFPGNNDVTHDLNIANTLEIKKWELSLGWTYRTGTPFTPTESFDPITGDIDFGAINSERLPNYHRLDASVRYKFGKKKDSGFRGTFGLSVQNIYNRQIPISVFYRVDTDPETELEELDRIEQLSLGFMPNATLRIFF